MSSPAPEVGTAAAKPVPELPPKTPKVDETKASNSSVPHTPDAAAATPAPVSASTPAAAPAPSAATPVLDELPDEPDGIINMEIFSQIQDMDEDDEDDGSGNQFSKSIVWGYFEQAENTFKQMEEAIAEPSLSKLSSLGHFLKGSSAALGIIKVQDSCEKMQHYGNLRDEEVGAPLTEDEALRRIKLLLIDCKRDYATASRWLRRLYGEEDEAA